MPCFYNGWRSDRAQPPRVGRPSRDRSKNKAQRRARKHGR